MSVLQSDIKFYLTGAVSDGAVQADPNASLGGYRSASEITSGALNNLFDNISSAEASAGDTNYRCICVKNDSLETLFNTIPAPLSLTDELYNLLLVISKYTLELIISIQLLLLFPLMFKSSIIKGSP